MTRFEGGLEGFDLIGDVHGCGATLAVLLERLGYELRGGVYRHSRRQAIFLGDLIDRGPHVRQALTIVRRMVESNQALIVMGNHEHNALSYCHRAAEDDEREWLRPHTPRNNRVIKETLEQFQHHPQEWDSHLAWFMEMPLCLERHGLRVVHACWDDTLIRAFLERCPDGRIDFAFLQESACKGSFAYRVIDRLTRGVHVTLPEGLTIRSRDGFTRSMFRAHFWANNPQTYGDVVFQPDELPDDLDSRALSDRERAQLTYYGLDEPPLFVGHYWCEGIPALPAPNIACLDYSAVKYGRLVAYRWDGERTLDANRFVWVRVASDEQSEKKFQEFDLF